MLLEGGGWELAYLALYRKYRPTNFDDLVGQEEIVDVIKNGILHNKLSHAYLFSGPRGTGKTSTAKIIARMINCKNLNESGVPCGQCDSCLNFNNNSDIVEIDAASNNGVDEIRELRDKVNLVPTYGKYKIYIIDEVHMLTTQAFNALLKTLEEPPAHAIFILATTEFYKIPVTVVSRCQKFQFLKFSVNNIVDRLRYIADNENIIASDEVLFEIARLSDGGLRDAINMLDQLSAFTSDKLSVSDVYSLNGVISYTDFGSLLTFILNNDLVKIINFMDNIDKNGKSFEHFIEDLISLLNDILIYKETSILNSNITEKNEVIKKLSDSFSEKNLYDFVVLLNDISIRIKNSSFFKILFVVEFLKYSNENFSQIISNKNVKKIEETVKNNSLDNNNSIINNNDLNKKISLEVTKKRITDRVKKIRINNAFSTASKKNKENLIQKWGVLKEKLSSNNAYVSIAGMMNDIDILVVGTRNIIFLAQYDSLLERLFDQIDLIERLLYDVYHIKYKVVFLLKDEWLFEKNRYISNLKAGQTYEYIEEENISGDNLENSASEINDIDKITSIFGEEIVSYE